MEERELIASITVNDYINRVQLSKARRVRYYTQGKKLPARCIKRLEEKRYVWKLVKGKKLLFDIKENQLVIANPIAQGTPKFKMINGQEFYSGFNHFHERIVVVNAIKDFFNEECDKIEPVKEYPISIEFVYHDVLTVLKTETKTKQKDIDNLRFAYEKCILDLFKKLNKIVDDNLLYIRKLSSEFIPVELKDRKLVINIYKY